VALAVAGDKDTRAALWIRVLPKAPIKVPKPPCGVVRSPSRWLTLQTALPCSRSHSFCGIMGSQTQQTGIRTPTPRFALSQASVSPWSFEGADPSMSAGGFKQLDRPGRSAEHPKAMRHHLPRHAKTNTKRKPKPPWNPLWDACRSCGGQGPCRTHNVSCINTDTRTDPTHLTKVIENFERSASKVRKAPYPRAELCAIAEYSSRCKADIVNM
jgi:hypothetical protein